MKHLVSALALTIIVATPAVADPCDTLIDVTQSALSDVSISDAQRSQLEGILNAGKAAKASGDISACESAMTSSTLKPEDQMSPMPSLGPGGLGHRCNKSQNTV
jgi:hypothetical protein